MSGGSDAGTDRRRCAKTFEVGALPVELVKEVA